MKRAIIIIALLAGAAGAFAQTKKDTVKKPQFEYFIKVDPKQMSDILNALHSYKDNLIYSPLMQADEKVSAQQNISAYIFNLQKNLKLDSLIKK